METKINKQRFSPSICVTHDCNLDCVYCYQEHETSKRMSNKTVKETVDWIFDNVPKDMSGIEIGFIGGEPLLEFELLKGVVEYTCSKRYGEDYIFYATTNGTVLTDEMKEWFSKHKNCFVLGLSLDGTRESHNYNRSNSFEKIDIEFFLENWPSQGIKMTLSEHSIRYLAENIKFLHSLGFKEIGGVNLSEGDFDWSKEEYIKLLVPQLNELVEFYVENESLKLNQMFDKQLSLCEAKEHDTKKWCGIGEGVKFFDVDGKMYPCPFVTPMTFNSHELAEISETDFNDENNFIDHECNSNCYIYPICATCAGANYLNTGSFKERDKRRCNIQKLVALFIADLQAKRIQKNPKIYKSDTLYYTIEAIKKIRELYLPEFEDYLK